MRTLLEALDEVDAAIRSFSSNVDLVVMSHLEMFLPHDVDLALLKAARSIVGDLPVFWEAPPDMAEQTDALLAEHNSDEDAATFGYKLRTGGVTADAFPTSAQIASALVTPATHQLPIKFTAGLHHAIRQFRDEVKTKMHGFLKCWEPRPCGEYRWDAQGPRSCSKTNPAHFPSPDFRVARLEDRRRRLRIAGDCRVFGSCSFDEPRDDLRALGLSDPNEGHEDTRLS
jgi:hypothetical protein